MSHLRYMVGFVFALVLLALPAQADGPPRWILADDDTKITLVGTFHVLPADLDWMQPDIEKAISEADTLYLELSPQQQELEVMQPLIAKMAFWRIPGEKLSNHVAPAMVDDIAPLFEPIGLNRAMLEFVEPWFVAVSLAAVQMQALGWEEDLGAENILTKIADDHGVEIRGLETAEFQLSVFDSLPLEAQVSFLETMVNSFETLEADSGQLLTAWSTGDVAGIDAAMNKGLKGHDELSKRLLADRNRNWVGVIEEILKYPGDVVMAVGAGHLAGDQSVINMLKAKGLKPVRIND